MTFDLTPSWSCIVFYRKCFWFVFRRNAVDLKGNMESSSVLKYKLPCWSIPPLSCIQLPCHYCHSLFLQESSMKWIHLSFHILVPQTECPIITPVLCHLPSPLMKKVLSTTCSPPPPLSLSGFRATYTVLQRNITGRGGRSAAPL